MKPWLTLFFSSPSSSSSHNPPPLRSLTRHLAPAASLLARNSGQLLFSLSSSLCGRRLPGHPSDRSDHLARPKRSSSLMHPCYSLCGWLRAPQTRARFSGYPSRRRGSSDGAPPPWVLPHTRAPLWCGPISPLCWLGCGAPGASPFHRQLLLFHLWRQLSLPQI